MIKEEETKNPRHIRNTISTKRKETSSPIINMAKCMLPTTLTSML